MAYTKDAVREFMTSTKDRQASADLIYTMLINVCGASPDERFQFRHYLLEPNHSWEWRFRGHLGFGGKFYDDGWEWRVGCYREDMNRQRENIIADANTQLAKLRAERVRAPEAEGAT